MNVKQLDCLLAEHEQKRGRLWLRIRAVVRRFLDLNWEGEGMTKEEQEKCELLGIIQGKDKAIKDLRDNYEDYKAVAESEIERLKKECGKLEGKVQDWTSEYYELENLMNNKLAEAKEIIKGLLSLKSTISSAQDAENRFNVREKAEEFLGKEE